MTFLTTVLFVLLYLLWHLHFVEREQALRWRAILSSARTAEELFEAWYRQWRREQEAHVVPSLYSPYELWQRPELVVCPKRGAAPFSLGYRNEERRVFAHVLRRCLSAAGLAPVQGWAVLTAIRR